MKPLSQNPSNSTPLSEQELREKLLKDYKVSKVSVTISQKIYSNNTVSPVEMKNQDIVEIGIDDLVDLILSDRKAWGEYLASTDVDLTHADTPEKGARYLREAIRQRNQGEKTTPKPMNTEDYREDELREKLIKDIYEAMQKPYLSESYDAILSLIQQERIVELELAEMNGLDRDYYAARLAELENKE